MRRVVDFFCGTARKGGGKSLPGLPAKKEARSGIGCDEECLSSSGPRSGRATVRYACKYRDHLGYSNLCPGGPEFFKQGKCMMSER